MMALSFGTLLLLAPFAPLIGAWFAWKKRALQPLFIAHLVVVVALLPFWPWLLLAVSMNESREITQIIFLGVSLFYLIASAWLAWRGKKNRWTGGVIVLMVISVALAWHYVARDATKYDAISAKKSCEFAASCIKLDGQPAYYCGAREGRTASIFVGDLSRDPCAPTKTQACALAAQVCPRISTDDSLSTVYKCGYHDLITCP